MMFARTAIRYIVRLSNAYGAHQCSLMACACAYCAVLSLVPLLAVGISALGLVIGGSQTALDQTLAAIRGYVPVETRFLRDLLERVLSDSSLTGLFGLVGLFIATQQMFLAMQPAMNRIWEVEETRHWLRLRWNAAALTFWAVALLGANLALTSLLVWVAERSLPVLSLSALSAFYRFALSLLPMSLTVLLFATLYRALPNCEVSARATLLGAVVAASLWELTKHLFAWYVIRFPSYDRLYGPLSSLVILLIWIYYSVSILFLGAEMAADYDKKRPQT